MFILLNTDVFINMDQNIQKYYELRSYLCCLLTGMVGFSGLLDDMGSPTLYLKQSKYHHCRSCDANTFRLGTVKGDLVNFDFASGGTGEPDRDWSGEAPALLVPSSLEQNNELS